MTTTAMLHASAVFWFAVAVIGQWAFVVYIASRYWRPAVLGHFAAVKTTDLIKGYVAGDDVGNLYFAAHVLIAALITTSGALQLVPQIRSRAIGFHRWNGRFYIVTSFLMAASGLWLIWVRGTYFTIYGALSSTLLAALLMLCATLALVYARARKIAIHRQWALRTFILANGVWFQRLGYMAWSILARGAGIGDHLDGPFDIVWGFGCYLIPLAILEIYLWTRANAGPVGRFAMATALIVLTATMGIGIVGAAMFMWGPHL